MAKKPFNTRNVSRRIASKIRGRGLPKIVSLFSGAGGLDHGFKAAGFKISAAFDLSPAAILTHKRNFPRSTSIAGDLRLLKPAGVAAVVRASIPDGDRIGIIGGPPCQGFSRANTTAEAADPRNKLPALYIEIVRELQKFFEVEFVVFENVLGMRDKKHADAYKGLLSGLRNRGFEITEKELCATEFGVPQTRKRIILSAMRKGMGYGAIRPRRRKGKSNVKEAISDLPPPIYFARDLTAENIPFHPNHWTMNPVSPRFGSDMRSNGGRCFKRLDWNKPSPTIAFGHREIHVHPNGLRRLSIFEAMRLQGFPDDFVLEGNLSEQVEQISNAVPPPVAKSVANAIRRTLAG
ncbi:DNA cytosine methyltransferase [Mesorhizobium sp.]|uniref:DNA cytosine methyltransferase n=1 Tax=Mesorhizobium sp. TaxID=1871066 RepID=UPI0025CD31EF|nr:DNA cytosine methyltransferase [Mesorhizobium sp.]